MEKNTFVIEIQNDSLKCYKNFYLVTENIRYNKNNPLRVISTHDTLLLANNTFPDIYGIHVIFVKLCNGKYVNVCHFSKDEYWKKYHVNLKLRIGKNNIIGYQKISNYIDDVFAKEKHIKGVREDIVFQIFF